MIWWLIGLLFVLCLLAAGDHHDGDGSLWSEGE